MVEIIRMPGVGLCRKLVLVLVHGLDGSMSCWIEKGDKKIGLVRDPDMRYYWSRYDFMTKGSW
jgi:hypothetical protein